MVEENVQSIPKPMRPAYEAVVALTDAVCREHLNEEYAALARRLAAALARKRPSPLARGRPEVWACGIVHALGMVNFLFDSSQTPHLRASELYALFGVKEGSGGGKSKLIRDTFKMYPFDPAWCLSSRIDDNPVVWMISVNGMIVDARCAPREIQAEAFLLGLIPYIPADQSAAGRDPSP